MSKQKSRKIISKKGRKTPYMSKKVRTSSKASKKTKRRRTRSMHKKGGNKKGALRKFLYNMGEKRYGEKLIMEKLAELKKKWDNFKAIRWERRYSAEEIYFAKYGDDDAYMIQPNLFEKKIVNPVFLERRKELKADFETMSREEKKSRKIKDGYLRIALKSDVDQETNDIYESCYNLIYKNFATSHFFWSCDGEPPECSKKKLDTYRDVYNITREMINNERWRDFLKRVNHFAPQQYDHREENLRYSHGWRTNHYNKGLKPGRDFLSQENLFYCKKVLEKKIIKNINKIIGEKVPTEDEEDEEDGVDEIVEQENEEDGVDEIVEQEDEKPLKTEHIPLKKEKEIIKKLRLFDEKEHEFIYDGAVEGFGKVFSPDTFNSSKSERSQSYDDGLKICEAKKLVVNELEEARKSKDINKMQRALDNVKDIPPPQSTKDWMLGYT
jgi:hypothetical protein